MMVSPNGSSLYSASRVKRPAARSALRVSQASLYWMRNLVASLVLNGCCGARFVAAFFTGVSSLVWDMVAGVWGRKREEENAHLSAPLWPQTPRPPNILIQRHR